MSAVKNSEDLNVAIHDPEELRSSSRSPLFFIVAVLAALAVTAALLGGYFILRSRHAAQTLAAAEQQQQQQSAATTKQAPPPELKIFEDQAMIKGTQVVVGGAVQNISNAPLSDISLELELTRRAGGTTEMRTIALAPKDLAPGEQGKYALTILSRDYKRARIVRVKSGSRANEIAFTTAPGNQRPAGPPQQTNKTIVVNRPAPKDGNSGFINTPDNPTTIR
jgi:type II secretory pathway pseudopilin PulG